MIESVYKKINSKTGIIYVLINTTKRWIDFQVNRVNKENAIAISFFDGGDVEYMPGSFEYDQTESVEYIDMHEDFNVHDYIIFRNQCKDQITLILIPRKSLMCDTEWAEY